jgi:hypothetical protein
MSRTTTESGPSSTAAVPDALNVGALGAGEAAEHLSAIADLIDHGNPRAARQRMSWLTSRIDDDTRGLLVMCLQALEAPGPKSRTARLDHLLARTDAVTRAVVVACLPHTDSRRTETRSSTTSPTHRARRAPRDHDTRHVRPTGRSRTAYEASTLRATHRYFECAGESGHGQDDSADDARGPLPYDRVDDADLAAVPLRGTACVSCFSERSVVDQHRDPDDGLCEYCRESGSPGIPAPSGPTRADAVVARCRFLTERAGSPSAAVALMRREWRAAGLRDRVVIVAWVQDQPALATLLTA